MTADIEFRVAPWLFGEGPPDDPFPCDCEGMDCVVAAHSGPVQEWFRRQELLARDIANTYARRLAASPSKKVGPA